MAERPENQIILMKKISVLHIRYLDQISIVLSTLMLLQSKINNTCTNFQIRHFFLIINQNVVLCREKQDESTCA